MNEPVQRPDVDIKSLVQHIALNESGWWEHAVERLVLATSFSIDTATRLELESRVQETCGLKQVSDQVRRAIDRLVVSGSMVEFEGTLRISEALREQLESEQSAVLDGETRVRDRFILLAQARDTERSPEELWHIFETEVVLPTVKLMGARLYDLLTSTHAPKRNGLEANVRDMVSEYDEQTRTLFAEFLDPSDGDTRRYVLRRLSAQYAMDAAALSRETLANLGHHGNLAQRTDVFLDTNVLFSVLGLHENPNDDVSVQLLELIEEIGERVHIRLYVVPETLREAQTTIGDIIRRLKDFRGQGNLAAAARLVNSQGLMSPYLAAASASPRGLTAKEFFGPYESDLLTILRQKGVELFNKDLGHLHMDQTVIDDLHEQEEIQERVRPKGAKSYEANIHDMVLWHFVADERRSTVESPLSVDAWIVTLDYGFIRFDRSKLTGTGDIPVCLDPGTLLQMMQFWLPSTQTLEEALVGTLRQPLLFLPFDLESEQVTIRILNQLSRYENSEDLDVSVVAEILTNQALRNRISELQPDPEFDQQVVKEEIVSLAQGLRSELQEAHADIDRLEAVEELAKLEQNKRQGMERQLERLRTQRAEDIEGRARLEANLSETAEALGKALDSKLELSEELEAYREASERGRARKQLVVSAFEASGLGLATGTLILLAAYIMDFPRAGWLTGLAVALWTSLWYFERALSLKVCSFDNVLRRVSIVRRAWWAFVLAVAASVVAEFLA